MDKKKGERPGWMFVVPWGVKTVVGGVTRVVASLKDEMVNEGEYQPIVFIIDWREKKPKITIEKTHIEIRYRLHNPASDVKSFLLFCLNFFPQLLVLGRLLKKYNVKVVNVHYPGLASAIFYLKRKCNRAFRLIISFHGTDLVDVDQSSVLQKKMWRWLMTAADRIVGCSDKFSKRVASIFPNEEEKIRVINNGISSASVAATSKTDLQSFKPYLLSVGAFERVKGFDVMIESFASVVKDFDDLSLIIVGRRGGCLAECRALVNDLNMQGKIHFVESIPHHEIYSYYENALLFVSSSRAESFGIVILEAGMFGLPVVATRTDGATEIIDDATDGKLVDVESAPMLEIAIRDYLNDPRQRAAHGKALQTKVVSRFSWRESYSQYKALVEGSV